MARRTIEDRLPTAGFLSIMASLMRDKYVTVQMLYEFIRKWEAQGYFEGYLGSKPAWIKDDTPVNRINLIERIVTECIPIQRKDLRIDLQRTFGQLDEAQVCEHCGDIMYSGYSWYGTTYCCMKCVREGEGIDDKEAHQLLKDADDPDGHYYYTEW